MKKHRLQIYILCRDRPIYFRQSLDSVLFSSNGIADVIISDNSETDVIQELVAVNYPDIEYIRRNPPTDAFEHFRVILKESSAEFIVLFHDDDIMMPSYAKTMIETLDNNMKVAAVGCNALLLRGDNKTDESTLVEVDKPKLFYNQKEFIQKHISIWQNGFAPFPGYMYRREFTEGLYLNKAQGGKYSDISFLTNIIPHGAIIWLPEHLMWYRIHEANDFKTPSTGDRLSLLRYALTIDGIDCTSWVVREFRVSIWAYWWRQRSGNHRFYFPKSWREQVVFKFLLVTRVRDLICKSNYRKMLLKKYSELLLKIITR
ncbi:MAG: glycosyltransferase [Burkholderiaceae bacterium]|nr:glycosyltransferase [Burkholderiaceae bacterium]